MQPAGLAAVAAAKADGRWEAAYHSFSTAEMPEDFLSGVVGHRQHHESHRHLFWLRFRHTVCRHFWAGFNCAKDDVEAKANKAALGSTGDLRSGHFGRCGVQRDREGHPHSLLVACWHSGRRCGNCRGWRLDELFGQPMAWSKEMKTTMSNIADQVGSSAFEVDDFGPTWLSSWASLK
jgi:hypothetical protein